MREWYRHKKGQHSHQERRPKYFLNPDFHLRHPRVCIMPPAAGLHVFLSYRFPDGMIHDSLVPCYVRGVAHLMQLHASQLITRTGTRSTRIHRRRWRSESLVDKQLDLNATILLTAFTRFVLSNRIHFTVAERRHDASERNVVTLNQVTNNGISTTLAQRAIEIDAAS